MSKAEQIIELLLMLVDTPKCDLMGEREIEALGFRPAYMHRDEIRDRVAEKLGYLLTEKE